MDINVQAQKIIKKYIKRERKKFWVSDVFLKKVIREQRWNKSQKIGIMGVAEDIEKFLKCTPSDVSFTMIEYINPNEWKNDPGYTFRGEEQIIRVSKYKLDVLVIVSDSIRYLAQMYLINENVSYEVVDIYDIIKREYGRELVDGLVNPVDTGVKEFIKSAGIWLADNTGLFSQTQFITYWKNGKRRFSESDNYDAILVKRYKMENAYDIKIKIYYLRELILNYLYIRDFNSAFYYIRKYDILNNHNNSDFDKVEKELNELFVEMKEKLSQRRQKDIILFWCDSIPYQEFVGYGFLKEEAQNSLFFENAYTHNPYTHTTSQTLWTGMPFFEGGLYDWNKPTVVKQGRTIDFLENNGYKLCEIHSNYIQEKYVRDLFYTVKSSRPPAAMNLWEMLAQLLENENNKYFIVCHMTCEMHPPYWNGISRKMCVGSNNIYADETLLSDQIRESSKYLSTQILWYSNFLGENACRIYMSDHGHGTPTYLEKKVHTFCFVKDKRVKKGRFNKFFSYLNFYKLLEYILEPSNKKLDDIFSEYILIQGDHPYGKAFCEDIVEKLERKEDILLEKWMGYRGIIKNGYKLVCFPNGKEVWMDMDDNRIGTETIKDMDLIKFMREHVGHFFPDLSKSKHYCETKKLYERLNII